MFRLMVWLVLATTFTHAHAASDTLTVHGNRLFIPVTINGMKVEALLDSAAEMTFIDPRLGAQLQLETQGAAVAKGSGGQTQASFADGVNIDAVGVRLRDMTVAMLDLTDDEQETAGEINVGTSVLQRFVLVIDYSQHAAWLRPG